MYSYTLERAEARIETVLGPLVVEVCREGGEVQVEYSAPPGMQVEVISQK